MQSRQSVARRAGLLNLIAVLPAPFALLYVPRKVFVAGDPGLTADRIRESASLMRMAIAAELWNGVLIVFVAFALYRLFEDVDRNLAAATAVLMWVAVPIQMLNLAFTVASLTLATNAAHLQAFPREQMDALAYIMLQLHARGIEIAQVFWGLWLFPWGLAAMRSGFIPRWIGAAEFVAGTGYVLASLVALAAPQLARAVAPYLMGLGAGEFPMTLWLIFWGAREPRPVSPGSPARP